MMKTMTWPQGKRFAFTIFDDTDGTTLENGSPVYDLLYDLGFLTTKSVWPLEGEGKANTGGTSCQDQDYLRWVQQLQKQGFEIALHNASDKSSTRLQTQQGLDSFKQFFGHDPRCFANHSICTENIYWGGERLSGLNKLIYHASTRFKNWHRWQGHIKDSPYFWGDLCQEHIQYVRNFIYSDINTLKVCPQMPYHDPKRPFVNHWFASSEGSTLARFNQTLQEANQDQLEQEGGACIMYTHFGKDFYKNGQINPRFKLLMQRLSQKSGWFVPVSTLLDYLRQHQTTDKITHWQRCRLEYAWLMHKFKIGATS